MKGFCFNLVEIFIEPIDMNASNDAIGYNNRIHAQQHSINDPNYTSYKIYNTQKQHLVRQKRKHGYCCCNPTDNIVHSHKLV